jgi:hypothetical protein
MTAIETFKYNTCPSWIMGFIRKALGIAALVLTLAGCQRTTPRNYNFYVDLNRDKRPDVVAGDYSKSHWSYDDYDLTAKISNPNGSYGKPKLLMRFKDKPDQIDFVDIDGDGDLDLVFSEYGKYHLTYDDYDTFVAKNDGR